MCSRRSRNRRNRRHRAEGDVDTAKSGLMRWGHLRTTYCKSCSMLQQRRCIELELSNDTAAAECVVILTSAAARSDTEGVRTGANCSATSRCLPAACIGAVARLIPATQARAHPDPNVQAVVGATLRILCEAALLTPRSRRAPRRPRAASRATASVGSRGSTCRMPRSAGELARFISIVVVACAAAAAAARRHRRRRGRRSSLRSPRRMPSASRPLSSAVVTPLCTRSSARLFAPQRHPCASAVLRLRQLGRPPSVRLWCQ